MRVKLLVIAAALSSAAVPSTPGYAQNVPTPQLKAEIQAAWQAAAKTAIVGPAEIKLLDEATLKITSDQVFVPAAEADKVMVALGNTSTPSRYGLVVGRKDDVPWMVDVRWIKEGYVRDGDAKEWQADALLEDLRQGTEQGNAQRIARGLPALDVTGWVEKPAYDPASHRLVWSLSLRDRGAPTDQPQTINYNTYALGREGYFSLDLITGSDTIGMDKLVARDLLGTLVYLPGKRYEDFSSSTDKVAAYGLGALVGVVAVKKLGLLGLIGVFLLKIWKLAAIAAVGAAGAFRRFFKGRSAGDEAA
jgi:uncharacterized membrane-anchored protein